MKFRHNATWTLILLTSCFATSVFASAARQIPVADEVDVVIAGGGCGAVAAAVEAARAGTKVFLAAPRTYLGEDIAGTMRLWLEPGEEPTTELAREIFSNKPSIEDQSLPYTYKASLPSNEKHPDTKQPTRLLGMHPIVNVKADCVQYDSDVTITADLGIPQSLKEVQVIAFQRMGDFQIGDVRAELSDNNRKWKEAGAVACKAKGNIVTITLPLNAKTRFVRLTVTRAPKATRLLLGAIRFLPTEAAPQAKHEPIVRPLRVKTVLEQALRTANVNYLFGCYATDLLADQTGKPAGIVMANRSGRQAIIAKVVIDGTDNAALARMAGATFNKAGAGKQTVQWITIAGKAQAASDVEVRKLSLPVKVFNSSGELPTHEEAFWFVHTLQLDLAGDSWQSRAQLEQTVREKTYNATQFYSSDIPFVVPPVWIKAAGSSPDKSDVNICRPAGTERLWVLSGCAGVPREAAAKILRPVAMMDLGKRVGAAAAAEAKTTTQPVGVKVAVADGGKHYSGEVRERLHGLRPLPPPPCVPEAAHTLPILGSYDVVVVGGGTSGAAAGIGAARQGAKTLVIEYLHGLGGVGTLGMIGKYWYGTRVGFAMTVPQNPLEVRMEFLRHEIQKPGSDIWFGCIGCGTLMESNRVTGVVVATPYGRGIVLARTIIDGTGNAEVAADAGAETRFVDDNFALQASHMPAREVGAFYMNGNIEAVDVSDPLDVREALQKRKSNYFDRGQLVDSRERQHIVGDYCLDWLDQINHRTFPDSIAYGQSDYDSHGYQIHPYFMLKPARVPGDYKKVFHSYVPYRCLLPRGIEGMLVVGLGLSAHRDALPIVRMQPDLENIGYAAGVAAAMAAKEGITPRKIDVKSLQQHLVEMGNLSRDVLKQDDSFPMPKNEVAGAVQSVTHDYDGLEMLLAQPQDAQPLLHAAYDAADATNKLAYAMVLGIMGDAHGIDALLAEAQRRLNGKDFARPSDKEKMDEVVRLNWALGGTRDKRVVPVLCALGKESPGMNLQRLRAVVVSLGQIGDPAAAPTLAEWLKARQTASGVNELLIACSLYRCGDKDELAQKTLERLVAEGNGPYSRLAWQVLNSPVGSSHRAN